MNQSLINLLKPLWQWLNPYFDGDTDVVDKLKADINALKLEENKCEGDLSKCLVDLTKCKVIVKEPEVLGTLTLSEAYNLFSKLTMSVYLSDERYSLTSVEQARRFSEETKVAYRKWIANQHDCDEFSFALEGYWNDGLKEFAFGIAWSNNHAFNIMIDSKKEVYIVEPQNNMFYTIEQAKKVSSPDGVQYFPIRMIIC